MMGHPAYANRKHVIEATPGQPYEPFDTCEFHSWGIGSIRTLPMLANETPVGWDLLQVESIPAPENQMRWLVAAAWLMDHVEARGGRLGFGLVHCFGEDMVATFRRKA